tara:strand:+ start:632 stop:901 length:270 start_codon:yes stop_codon:yes gene_type:complete
MFSCGAFYAFSLACAVFWAWVYQRLFSVRHDGRPYDGVVDEVCDKYPWVGIYNLKYRWVSYTIDPGANTNHIGSHDISWKLLSGGEYIP